MLLLKAVHTLVEQKKITKRDSKKSKQATAMMFIDKHLYGKYWVLSSDQNSLEHDDDACKKFMTLCKSANDIISEAPFFSLDEEERTCFYVFMSLLPFDQSQIYSNG